MTAARSTKPAGAKQAKVRPNRRPIVLTIVIGVLALIVFAGWWFTRNTTVYSRDSAKLEADIHRVIDAVGFPGEIAYSKIQDDGCDDRNSVGLALNVHCDYTAQKMFRNSVNLMGDLDKADEVLRSLGFERRHFSRVPSDEARVARDTGHRSFSLDYTSARDRMDISLSFFDAKGSSNDVLIGSLIKAGAFQYPSDPDYIYGITIGASYFSCRWDSIFQQSCPQPPRQVGL